MALTQQWRKAHGARVSNGDEPDLRTCAARRRDDEAEEEFELQNAKGGGLPDGWVEHADDAGTPYYVHGPTGVSSWDPPLSESSASPDKVKGEHLLRRGMDVPVTVARVPPGDMFSELDSLPKRLDSLPKTRRSRMRSTVTESLPFVQHLAPEEADRQRAAEEAQAAARLKNATAEEFFSPEEVAALCSHANALLQGDPEVAHLLPLTPTNVAAAASGSMLLAKYLVAVDPESLDQRALNHAGQGHRDALSPEQRMQNHTLVVNALAANGCGLPDLQPEQLDEAAANTEVLHTVLWNLASYELLSPLTPKVHPEFFRLALPGEDLGAVGKLLPEQLVLRWVNHQIRKHLVSPAHLALPEAERTVPPNYAVANLSTDLADGAALSLVMQQLHPTGLTAANWRELSTAPPLRRAEAVCADAAALGCRRFQITPKDITSAKPKLLLGFLAELMGSCPGLETVSPGLVNGQADAEEEADDREARAYKCWLASLGVPTESNDLLEDCTSGLPLLGIMDKLWPGCVDWKRANARPRNVHERVENCNYALEIAQAQGMKVVGIGGKDIADGSVKLTLAILWQLMRADVMKFLSSMGMTERDIVRWANQRVVSIGSSLRIERCGDESVRTGVFLLQLLGAVAPDCVDEALVYGGGTQEECKLNAKYGISCAQKMGCRVFLTWEDIVQAKPKMVLTLLAAAMQQDMLRRNLGRTEVLNELEAMKQEEKLHEEAAAKAARASRASRRSIAMALQAGGGKEHSRVSLMDGGFYRPPEEPKAAASGCFSVLIQSLGLGNGAPKVRKVSSRPMMGAPRAGEVGEVTPPGFDYDSHGGWPGMDDAVGVSTLQASTGSRGGVRSFSSDL